MFVGATPTGTDFRSSNIEPEIHWDIPRAASNDFCISLIQAWSFENFKNSCNDFVARKSDDFRNFLWCKLNCTSLSSVQKPYCFFESGVIKSIKDERCYRSG